MKVGIRTPNIKKRIKARTTGKLKRKLKRSVNPLYGKKGMGFIKNPKKSIYNHVYKKTTVDLFKPTTSNIWYWIFIGFWWYPLKWLALLLWMGIKKIAEIISNKKDNTDYYEE